MGKRANGEGTIYKTTYKTKTGKEKTRWVGQYFDKAGKRNNVTEKTEQEVKDKMEIVKEQLRNGTYVTENITLGNWLKQWFYDFIIGSDLKPTTIQGYESIIRLHFLPDKISKIRLVDFSPEDLQDFYNRKQQPTKIILKSGKETIKKGLAPKYIANIHAMLHQALNMAIVKHYAYANVCEQIKSPNVPKKKIQTFSVEELNKIIENAKKMENGEIILLDISTGMRVRRNIGFKVEKYRLRNRRINSRKNYKQSKKDR